MCGLLAGGSGCVCERCHHLDWQLWRRGWGVGRWIAERIIATWDTVMKPAAQLTLQPF